MNAPGQKKLNADEIARQFVLRQQARHLSPEALTDALDAATLWRGLLAHYTDYARHQNSLVVRPDDVAEMMPEGYYAALPAEKRKQVRNAINKEWATQKATLAAVLRFIKGQCDALEDASPAFKQTYEDRLNTYLTEPLPQAA